MNIILKSISLKYFKGITSFSADFSRETDVFGNNATGKTTLFDAFTWLLFGKNSSDQKDFEVKTLDANNKAIPKIDHEVEAVLIVDGKPVQLKRILREKWVKQRGASETTFEGHETLFFWNDVPMQAKEYAAKVGEIVNEGLFKLLTNTLYFNSMKWQDRRNVLLTLAGPITRDTVLSTLEDSSKYAGLIEILNEGKSLKEYRSQIVAKKKTIMETLRYIPARIDEANQAMPEAADYSALEAQKAHFEKEIAAIDQNLLDISKAASHHNQGLITKQNELYALQSRLRDREYKIREEFSDKRRGREADIAKIENAIRQLTDESDSNQRTISANLSKIAAIDTQLNILRDQWIAEDATQLVFDESKFECPACKRSLEAHDIEAQKEQMCGNFNTRKASNLAAIEKDAAAAKANREKLAAENNALTQRADAIRDEFNLKQSDLQMMRDEHVRINANAEAGLSDAVILDPEASNLRGSITALEAEINAYPKFEAADNSGMLAKKQTWNNELALVNQKLATKAQRAQGTKRIGELKEEEKNLAGQIAELERTEFLCEQYLKAEMDTVEQRVNGLFQMVRFKLFEQQINGGEVECCETLIAGVPFSDANNASKINAGLDIINTLSRHHGVYATIFIDNAESVVKLLHTESQVIRLVVSADHPQLTVSGDTLIVNQINEAKQVAGALFT